MQLTLEKSYISGKPVRVDDLGGQLFGGEAQAHKFIVTQYAAQGSAETIAITGSVSGTLMASTGATVPLTGSLEDDKAVVVLDEDCYKVPGRFVLTIFVTSGDTTLCIYCGVGNVLRTSTDTVVYPTESLPNLAQLVDQVQAAIDSFPADLTALQAAIAENYDDLTYPIIAGTYAWHAGTLYKAKTDISAAESWTAAHWETVHAASDLAANVSQLKDYILITSESETEENYNNQDNITNLIVSGNSDAFGNVMLCDRRNILPSYPLYSRTHSTQPVTAVYNGRFISISGSSASSATLRPYIDWGNVGFESGDYKLIIMQSSNYTITNDAMSVTVLIKGTNGQKTLKNAYFGPSATNVQWDVTIDNGYTSNVGFYVTAPNGFNGTTKLWIGLFKKPYTIVDTEETVEDGQTIEVSVDPANYPYGVDAMQHKAIVEYHPPIQEYVDNHIPDDMVTESDLVYISPEMYGAVGNGSADDTIAVQTCINAAITNKRPVRGYGRYKTTDTINIDGSNLDIYIYSIIYTSGNSAVSIAGKNNKFSFGEIIATTSNTAKGITVAQPTSTEGTERLVIQGQTVDAKDNALYFTATSYMLYIVCRIKRISSQLGDAISTNNYIGELTVYDAYFNCPAGWCFNGSSIQLINCTMESNCWGGVYAEQCRILNCRVIELMDCLMPGNSHYGQRSGILFKNKPRHKVNQITCIRTGSIYYESIDLSEVTPYSDGTSNGSIYNFAVGVVYGPIQSGDLNYRYGHYYLGSEMLLHGKDKICVPMFESIRRVTETTLNLRDPYEGHTMHAINYPTKFIIDSDDCVIWLSPSYCAEGYKEFTVDMSNKMATIYDRRQGLLFDPTNNTNGVYRFKAYVDDTIDDIYQKPHNPPPAYPINSGYCDVWEIEKLS